MTQMRDDELFLTKEEADDFDTAESVLTHIDYVGQDFDVYGLVRRLDAKDIVIPSFQRRELEKERDEAEIESAHFQRGFVWTKRQMDRFIESILLGFPIPSIFLVQQKSDKRYLVLDGQQRLMTLSSFVNGIYNKRVFSLDNVCDDLKGLDYKTLSPDLRRTFDNTFIQAIVVKSDGTNEALESIYQIFERLNTGGTQLTPHEIRVALYAGPFIDKLEELNENSDWRKMYGPINKRLRDQELLLRILALYSGWQTYKSPMKVFLNQYAAENRNVNRSELSKNTELLSKALEILAQNPRNDILKNNDNSRLSIAVTDAIVVGLMNRLSQNDISSEEVSTVLVALKENADFFAATQSATADTQKVQNRIRLAIDAFMNACDDE